MPTFVLPKLKKRREQKEMAVSPSSIDNDQWRRQVQLPADVKILDSLDVGSEVEVTLTGKVIGVTRREGTEYQDRQFEIEIKSVSVYPDEEEEAEEAFVEGYRKLKKH